MFFRRNTKRVQSATNNQPAYVTGGLGFFTGWSGGFTVRAFGDKLYSSTSQTEEPTPELRDELFIGFEINEGYVLEPISQSSLSKIQGNWSGGSQTYFANDSTDNEIITNTRAFAGTNSWFTGNSQLYGNPGLGSPFTPALNIEKNAANESAFNESIKGKTICYIFYVYANSSDGTNNGSLLKVYNGTYQGNDRTGLNINITKNITLDVTTYTYSSGSGFSAVTLGNLSYDTWHKFEVFITYAADGNPDNDVFKYVINDGAPQFILSWPNVWRKDNSFAPVYGSRLAFATGTDPQTGWYIDNITIVDPPTPITIPNNYTPPNGVNVTPALISGGVQDKQPNI